MKNNLELRTAIFRNGKQITEDLIGFNFKQIGDYTILFNSNSLLIVDKDGNATLSEESSDNKLLKPLQFDAVYLLEHAEADNPNVYRDHDAIEVWKDGLKGVYSPSGKLIVPIEFDDIQSDMGDVILVDRDSLKGVYSYDGNIIVPIEFYNIDIEVESIVAYKNHDFLSGTYYSYDGQIISPTE